MALFIMNKQTGKYEQANQPQVKPVQQIKQARPNIRQSQNYLNAVANAQKAQQEATKAKSFGGMALNTLKASPRAALDTLIGTPIKFGASVAEIPSIVKNQQFTGKTYNVPGFSPFQSFQSDYGNVAKDVIEGKKSIGSAALSLAKIPLAGLETGTVLGGLSKGIGALKSGNVKQAAGQVSDAILPTNFSTPVGKTTGKGLKLSKQENVSIPYTGGVQQEAGKVKQRGFAKTVSESDFTNPKVSRMLQDSTYTPQRNDPLIKHASTLVNTDINKATDIALNGNDNLSVATASELIKHYQNQGNFNAAANLTKEVATKLTEAGRTIQAASLYNKLTPEGLLRYAQNELSKEGLVLQPEQAQVLTNLATEAHKLTGEKQVIAFTKMLQKVQEFIPSKFVDQLTTVWKAGLLTNPTTHIANVAGNATMTGLETIKDYPAVLLDKFASVFTGKRTKSLPSARAMASGAFSGGKKAWTFLKTGVDVDNTLGKIDYKQVNLPIGLKQYTQGIFRTLGATDKVFKETLLKKSLHELAVVDGLNQGLKGKKLAEFVVDRYANPTTQMVEQATKDALYGTFNNPNVLADALGKLKQSQSGVTRGLSELFAPFGRTPTNIAGRIFDYSPVGLAKGTIQGFQGNQRGAVESLSRGLVGSGIIGTGYGLGQAGQMTGNYPTNPTEQALWQTTGKQPGALKVGGNWQSLNRISPVGNLLSIGSGMADLGRMKPENVPGAMLGIAGKNLLGQTYLQGISGALNAFQDPNRYGKTLGSSIAQSVIPSVIGAAARATDPYQRQANTSGEAILARIPGLRQQLLPKVDVFGNKLMQESNPLINPFNTTKAKDTPVTNEINRLYQSYSGATIDHPNKSVNIGQGLKIDLTPSEYTAYEQRTGGAFGKILDALIKSTQYKQSSDYDKANAVNNVVSSVRKIWVLQNAGQLQNKGDVVNQVQDLIKKRSPNPFYTK